MFAKAPKPVKFARTEVKIDEAVVVPHLAFDLADLDALRRQGKPITTANVESMYYDGQETNNFDFPLEVMRGVDINDAWDAMQSGRKRVSAAGVRRIDLSNS